MPPTWSEAWVRQLALEGLVGRTVIAWAVPAPRASEAEERSFFGTIARASLEDGVVVSVPRTGQEERLPPRDEYFRAALPGIYVHRETRETVVSPDLLWYPWPERRQGPWLWEPERKT